MLQEDQIAFLNIIRCVVCGESLQEFISFDWRSVLGLGQKNRLEPIVFAAARKSDNVPPELMNSMERAYYAAIAHDVQQRNSMQRIYDAFEESGIPYAPMKGAILKADYPASHLRFMCDVDLCVRREDRETIRACMDSLGAMRTGESAGDDIYLLGGTGVEPQALLLYRLEDGQIINYPDWSFVDEERNRLTEEGFALNLIGHCVGDMRKGGPGLRYVLDLWVYRHRHAPQPDWNLVYARLEQDGILRAAQNLFDLSEYLFGDGERTDLMEEMAEYILSSSLYGNAERAKSTEVALSGGRGGAIAHQLFRDREDYENRYPWVKGRPWLMPAAWVARVVHSLCTHGRLLPQWLKEVRSVSRSEAEEQRARLKRFGL